jgi:hypothetical protein
MEIYTELLDRLRRQVDVEMRLSASIAAEAIEATRFVSLRALEESEARRRADRWPDDPRLAGMPPEERNTLLGAAADARDERRLTERLTGRAAVSEQSTLRRHAEAARAGGIDVETAVATFAAATAGADQQQILQQAWERAAEARAQAQRALDALEQQRGQHGKRAGQLRATLQQAEAWLATQGLAAREVQAA